MTTIDYKIRKRSKRDAKDYPKLDNDGFFTEWRTKMDPANKLDYWNTLIEPGSDNSTVHLGTNKELFEL